MKTNSANRGFKPGSLRGTGSARTVLLRMAVDEARAERIAELKDSRPDLTWRRIADAVGVSERAAFAWKKTGGIDYENAKALAKVFEVDVDYIWRGPPETDGTPDLLETVARAEQLDDIVARFTRRVDDVEVRLGAIENSLDQLAQAVRQLVRRDDLTPPGELGRRAGVPQPTAPDRQPAESRRRAADAGTDT